MRFRMDGASETWAFQTTLRIALERAYSQKIQSKPGLVGIAHQFAIGRSAHGTLFVSVAPALRLAISPAPGCASERASRFFIWARSKLRSAEILNKQFCDDSMTIR